MTLLAIDTAFGQLGYCISLDGEVLASHFARARRSNSRLLLPTLDLLLSGIGLQKTDISAVIVNQGPGSYTGVRIGLSFAKTFAQVFGIPLVPVPSLDVLAAQVEGAVRAAPAGRDQRGKPAAFRGSGWRWCRWATPPLFPERRVRRKCPWRGWFCPRPSARPAARWLRERAPSRGGSQISGSLQAKTNAT